jgi:hypothetical protein
MSMWSRLKVAVFAASVSVAALHIGGCGLNLSWDRILPLVAIGNIFD